MWQVVTTGTGVLVDQHQFGSMNGTGRRVKNQAVTVGPARQVFTAEHLDDVVGCLAARVGALVNDEGFLVDLGEKHPVEKGIPGTRGVGQIDIAYAAAGGLIDLSAIVLNPGPQA